MLHQLPGRLHLSAKSTVVTRAIIQADETSTRNQQQRTWYRRSSRLVQKDRIQIKKALCGGPFLFSRAKRDDTPGVVLAAAFLPNTPTKSRPIGSPHRPSSGDDMCCYDHVFRIGDGVTGRSECMCAMTVHLKVSQWHGLCVFVCNANRVDHRHTRSKVLFTDSACMSCVLRVRMNCAIGIYRSSLRGPSNDFSSSENNISRL